MSALGDVLKDLLTHLGETFGETLPGRVNLTPGAEVAWDCEQLWIRVLSIAPTGGNTPAARQCGPPAWDVSIGVGVLRCVATVDNRGKPPAADKMTGEALLILDDMEALSIALRAYTPSSGGGVSRKIHGGLLPSQWAPLGPEGGYAGGEWRVDLRVGVCG